MIPVDVAPVLPAAHIPYGAARLGVLVARRVWPGNPCIGHEQVQASWIAPKWTRRAATALDGAALVGAADLAGRKCLIWVDSAYDDASVCEAVVHELGHWDGQEHSAHGVMQAEDADRYPPCEVPS
jgi:hypothetical protein